MHPMELLGDVGHVESRFGRTGWNSKVTWVMWNLVSVCLEIVSVLVQDRCTVYAK
jgi:hypothetical protein